MGGVCCRSRIPPGGMHPRGGDDSMPRITIRGSEWCCNEDLDRQVKSVQRVSAVETPPPSEKVPGSVDWSPLLPQPQRQRDRTRVVPLLGLPGVTPVCDLGKVPNKVTCCSPQPCWLQAVNLCSSVLARMDCADAGEDFEVLVLEGVGKLRRIIRPSLESVERIVSKHPVVTSLRCNHPDTEEALGERGAEHLHYLGSYNLDWIPHCALLVGYTEDSWIVFRPGVGSFGVDKQDYAGAGEFLLWPGDTA